MSTFEELSPLLDRRLYRMPLIFWAAKRALRQPRKAHSLDAELTDYRTVLRPQVSVQTLPANTRGLVTVVPIRWFIDGVGDGPPSLDANLEIGPAETTNTTLLILVGLFRPIGSGTDQGLLQQNARRIPRDLLTTVAALLALSPASKAAEHSV